MSVSITRLLGCVAFVAIVGASYGRSLRQASGLRLGARIKPLLGPWGAALVTLSLMAVVRPALGAADVETLVKVAYVFNFTKFVDWPEPAVSARAGIIQICVVGSGPVSLELDGLNARQAKGRTIQVLHLNDESGALTRCHLLYVSRSEEVRLPALWLRLQGQPILTVSDIPEFAQRGGMIGLVTDASHVRFEVHAARIREAGLRLSAKVLELATVVR